MAKKKGMPVPIDNGDGLLCLRVFVPNSTEWVIMAKSAIYAMSRGRYWNGETGSIMDAQLIAQAMYNTAMVGDCDCGEIDLSGVETSIEQLSQELIDMQVIVNNNFGCGCSGVCSCGGSSGGVDLTPPDWVNPYDLIIPPLPDGQNQTDVSFDAWKCQASNHGVTRLKALVISLREMVALGQVGFSEFVERVNAQFADSFAVDVVFALFSSVVTFVTGVLDAEMTRVLTDWIDENYGSLVDSIHCAESPTGAYTGVLGVINDSSASTVVKYALRFLFLIIPYRAMFLEETERGELPTYAYVCGCPTPSSCALLPNLPAGYECIQVPLVEGNTSVTLTDAGDDWYRAELSGVTNIMNVDAPKPDGVTSANLGGAIIFWRSGSGSLIATSSTLSINANIGDIIMNPQEDIIGLSDQGNHPAIKAWWDAEFANLPGISRRYRDMVATNHTVQIRSTDGSANPYWVEMKVVYIYQV